MSFLPSSSSSCLWTVYAAAVVSRCCCGDVRITARPGQDVALPCLAPPGGVTVLEWIKPDLDQKLYVFFLRQNRPVESFLHPSFRKRTALLRTDAGDGNVTVTLRNVTVNDTGKYECRVLVDKAQSPKPTLQNVVHLEVEDDFQTSHGLSHPQGGGGGSSTSLVVGLVVAALVILFSCVIFCKRKHRSFPKDETV